MADNGWQMLSEIILRQNFNLNLNLTQKPLHIEVDTEEQSFQALVNQFADEILSSSKDLHTTTSSSSFGNGWDLL
jgi:hypothetical protein